MPDNDYPCITLEDAKIATNDPNKDVAKGTRLICDGPPAYNFRNVILEDGRKGQMQKHVISCDAQLQADAAAADNPGDQYDCTTTEDTTITIDVDQGTKLRCIGEPADGKQEVELEDGSSGVIDENVISRPDVAEEAEDPEEDQSGDGEGEGQ